MNNNLWIADRVGYKLFDTEKCPTDIVFFPAINLLYFAHSKNASSFLKWYFTCCALGRPWTKPSGNPHSSNEGSFRLSELPFSTSVSLLESNSITKVSVWREPLDRLGAAYHSRYLEFSRESYNKKYQHQWVKIRKNVLGYMDRGSTGIPDCWTDRSGFEEFLKTVSSIPAALRDIHFARQSDVYSIDRVGFNLCGVVDNLDSMLETLHEQFDVPRITGSPQFLNQSANGDFSRNSQTTPSEIKSDYRQDFEIYAELSASQ